MDTVGHGSFKEIQYDSISDAAMPSFAEKESRFV